jgi:carbon-monoxide dehydrogenase small subunit
MEKIEVTINGNDMTLLVDEKWTLLYLLREVLKLTGVKPGCKTGDCGACKVIIDGEAKNSCLIKATKVDGKKIETIEGVSDGQQLHPLQEEFITAGAVQCGYCTPGMIMTAKAALDKNPNISEEKIRQALSNNLCRCTGYAKIVEAIQKAGIRMSGDGTSGRDGMK